MKRAFTLFDRLVVIAIIAVLPAIRFPAFAQAELAAISTSGMSQAKQINTGTPIHLADFNDVPSRFG